LFDLAMLGSFVSFLGSLLLVLCHFAVQENGVFFF
jgi:hypothetical protein